MKVLLVTALAGLSVSAAVVTQPPRSGEALCSMTYDAANEKQITHAPHGHILTNIGVWSPDSQWIVYDVRSDAEGSVFDGTRIQRVNVSTGEVQTLYESSRGAKCGVVTYSPVDDKVVFIHGPEQPTDDWQYAANHRRGVTVDVTNPGHASTLDARDITPPFTPGALRGGTHVHVFSGDGHWLSFTYQDHVLAERGKLQSDCEQDQRNVGVSVPGQPVYPMMDHPRNHSGTHFSVLVTRTTDHPKPGSDEISRAFEDAWVGTNGYVRSDGTRQHRALAFQGHVVTRQGQTISEAFIVDLPEHVTVPDEMPLEGTATRRPRPPKGVVQRRLTYTADRKFPGLQGPRHWLRSSPAGSRIAMLMKDDDGVVQVFAISPNGGGVTQITRNPWSIASAFSWSADGQYIGYIADNSVFVTSVTSGQSTRLTPRSSDDDAPRPEACVFSPDGAKIAFIRTVEAGGRRHNQVFALLLRR